MADEEFSLSDNILSDIKLYMGIEPDENSFDNQITNIANTIFSTLQQEGVGDSTAIGGFVMNSKSTWDEFLGDGDNISLSNIITFVCTKTKLLFDPSGYGSATLDAMGKYCDELEWRLYTMADNKRIAKEKEKKSEVTKDE